MNVDTLMWNLFAAAVGATGAIMLLHGLYIWRSGQGRIDTPIGALLIVIAVLLALN